MKIYEPFGLPTCSVNWKFLTKVRKLMAHAECVGLDVSFVGIPVPQNSAESIHAFLYPAVNLKELEMLTRSALMATLRFTFFHDNLSEQKLEEFADLLLPTIMPLLPLRITDYELDFEMRRVIFDVVEAFHDRCAVCGVVNK